MMFVTAFPTPKNSKWLIIWAFTATYSFQRHLSKAHQIRMMIYWKFPWLKSYFDPNRFLRHESLLRPKSDLQTFRLLNFYTVCLQDHTFIAWPFILCHNHDSYWLGGLIWSRHHESPGINSIWALYIEVS